MNRNTIKAYYDQGLEQGRLELDYFMLEGIRTKEIISRFLPPHPQNILDLGGGPGYYSFWLAALGHQISLVDLSAQNIALANEYASQKNLPLVTCKVGDATNLDLPDDQFDIVLLMGPLYHLTERTERIKALTEARRVLKPGGVLLAAVISRYASLFDGFRRDLIRDDEFQKIVTHDLATGIHVNHTDNPEYFTTAFFHTPAGITNEIVESGLQFRELVAIESAGWMIDDLREKSTDQHYFTKVLQLIKAVESNDDLMALSPHIMAIGKK